MKALSSYLRPLVIELVLRLFVAVYIAVYGWAKVVSLQFQHRPEALERKIAELNGFELTWLFFGHAYGYGLIIGLTQILGAILLVVGRTRLIGCLLLLPVLFNIILIDLFYGIPRGATANAILYLLCLLGVLYINRVQVMQAISSLVSSSGLAFSAFKKWQVWVVLVGGVLALHMMAWVITLVLSLF